MSEVDILKGLIREDLRDGSVAIFNPTSHAQVKGFIAIIHNRPTDQFEIIGDVTGVSKGNPDVLGLDQTRIDTPGGYTLFADMRDLEQPPKIRPKEYTDPVLRTYLGRLDRATMQTLDRLRTFKIHDPDGLGRKSP